MTDNEKVLNEILSKVGKEQGYENYQITTKQISSDGASYTSFLYLATISSPGKDDLKLFVKVAAVGEEMRKATPFRIFEIETFGYTELLKTYKELEEKYNVPTEHRLMVPKFYSCSNKYLREALVIEDLTASGYTTYDRFKSVDWEYASKSVQNLAKLHALSIAWSFNDPEEFEKTKTINMNSNIDGIAKYIENIIINAIQVTREENRERLSIFVKKLMEDKDKFIAFYKPIIRPVIAHGDYRPSNLMHRVNTDGNIEIISVDYQTLQQANPILDLMYFLFNGSDKNFRDKHFRQTLDHYYAELSAALRRFQLDPDDVYPKKDFEYELEKVLPFGLMTGMLCLLLVTVDVDNAPKVSKDIVITDFAINPNALYTQRLNEIVDDFINMGII